MTETHRLALDQLSGEVARLRELGPGFPPDKLSAWLRWPYTPELGGALVRVAEELWEHFSAQTPDSLRVAAS